MARVLVAGHVNCDVTLVADRLPAADEELEVRERHRSGGGSAANVAVGLAGLSVPVQLLGSVGDDETGERVRAALADRGVDVEDVSVVPGETSTKYLLVAGDDVAVLGVDGVNEAIGPEDVDRSDVADVEHVHLTGQRVATAERLAELAVEAGCTVSLDPGRRAGDRSGTGKEEEAGENGEEADGGRDLATVIEYADLVFGTDREVAALFEDGDSGGGDDVEIENAAGETLQIVETSGAGGATLYGESGTQTHSGFEVDVADTSGAGDAFVAGFLSTWLDGGGHERALEVGNACGAIASRRVGARTDLDRTAVASLLEST